MPGLIKPIVGPIETLSTSKVVSAPLDSLSLPEKVQAHVLLSAVESVAKERKDAIRDVLLKEAKDGGDKNDKGHYKVVVEGSTVSNERRVGKEPNPEKLKALLAAKGIPEKTVFSTRTVVESFIDPSKLDALVSTGKLSKEEIEGTEEKDGEDGLYPVTRALRVTPSKDLKVVVEVLKANVGGTDTKALTE
jgi:hypothetical protein